MATTNSAFINNYGLRTGLGANTGQCVEYSYATSSVTVGTFSIVPNADRAYYLLPVAMTGTVSLSVNATYSTICQDLKVMFTGNATTTYSVTFAGDVSANSTSLSVSPGKYAIYMGTFNGTKYIGNIHNQL